MSYSASNVDQNQPIIYKCKGVKCCAFTYTLSVLSSTEIDVLYKQRQQLREEFRRQQMAYLEATKQTREAERAQREEEARRREEDRRDRREARRKKQ